MVLKYLLKLNSIFDHSKCSNDDGANLTHLIVIVNLYPSCISRTSLTVQVAMLHNSLYLLKKNVFFCKHKNCDYYT